MIFGLIFEPFCGDAFPRGLITEVGERLWENVPPWSHDRCGGTFPRALITDVGERSHALMADVGGRSDVLPSPAGQTPILRWARWRGWPNGQLDRSFSGFGKLSPFS